MKSLCFLFSLMFISIAAFSQETEENEEGEDESSHCYFKKNSVSIGLGVLYSIKLQSVGANARVYYNLGDAICFGPEFSYFNNGQEEVVDFDIVGHYIFETPWMGVFPLAGVNYTIEKGEHRTEEAFGVAFGAGLHRNFGKISLFGEYAHVESALDDDFVTIGLFYNIK